MVALSSLFPLKVLLVTLVSLTLLLAVNGYLGPRYGKRDPGEADSLKGYGRVRVVGRSAGQRGIQSRSQTRFYAGSRYGGKRSYWQTPVLTDLKNSDSPSSNVPYDCVYSLLGVRCATRQDDGSIWNNDSDDDQIPSLSNVNNQPSEGTSLEH